MRRFDHEKLEVYQRALTFAAAADALRSTLLARRASLADQLERASISIVLNIAEGAGEFAPREKVRFYRIARRSGTECAAVLDIMERIGIGCRTDTEGPRELLLEIVSMLTALAKRKIT
jgi:four helix bundle protein